MSDGDRVNAVIVPREGELNRGALQQWRRTLPTDFFDAQTGSQTLRQIRGMLNSDTGARRWAWMAKALR